jgi:Na+/proline symporter
VNSLATVICIDFIQRLRQRRASGSQVTLVKAQWVTLACGIAITMAAVGVHLMQIGSLVAAAIGVIGFFSGPLLGMFLLGMFSLRASSFGAVMGALTGFGAALLLCDDVSFIWYPVVGCAPTLIVGWMLSFFLSTTTIDAYSMTVWGRGTLPADTSIEKYAATTTSEQG